MKPYQLGTGGMERVCAVLLGSRRSVITTAAPKSAAAVLLRGAGFQPLVSEWHCLRDLRYEPGPHDRKSRLALRASLAAWRTHGLKLELTTVDDVGLARLEREFYFAILVPELYAKGRAPYGAQNLYRFRESVRPGDVVAMVHQGSELRGGALLRGQDLTRLDAAVAGSPGLDTRRTLAGRVYALAPSIEECRRAFMHGLAVAARQGGWTAFSYGADDGWVDRGYVPVILEKLRWADAVLAATRSQRPYLRYHGGRVPDDTGIIVTAGRTSARIEPVSIDDEQLSALRTRVDRIDRLTNDRGSLMTDDVPGMAQC